ncbi:MAG: TonB-dependent receptor [Candidatus Aminicenantales bacterium]
MALEIKGRVLSTAENPVPEAVVIHRASGNKIITDREGYFSLSVPEGKKVKLTVLHPEYMEEEVTLSKKDMDRMIIIFLVRYIRQKEEVVVTALRYPEPSAGIPAAETLIPAQTIVEKMAPNITEALSTMPGVSTLGSGGFSLVPTIRGLARRRILLLVDNTRIVSDRRTGPNASFISPEDIEKIEVLRSPSSIFYGSDAIGGVVHIFTKGPDFNDSFRGKIHTAFGMVNEEKSLGFSVSWKKGEWGFYLSVQGRDAENYSSPIGEVWQSQYSQGSLFGKVNYRSEKREIQFAVLGARGINIGKPNRGSETKPTWYPHENQNLIQFHWKEKNFWDGDLSFNAYLNPNYLETLSDKIEEYKSKESCSQTGSTDLGFQISYGRKLNSCLRIMGGVDYFGRLGVSARNKDTNFDFQGNVTSTFEELPFTHGMRSDLGFYISADYSGLKNWDLVGGIRLDVLRQKANPGDQPDPLTNTHNSLTGFLACSYKLSDGIVAFANFSRAFRAPGLNERFYTGITGRGFIIAQPDLKPETSQNFDLGLKFFMTRFYAGFYTFIYQIDGMIERYIVAEKTYTYGNLNKGQIKGVELEMEYYPVPGWKIFGNLFSMKGMSRPDEAPLNDIPPFRIVAGTRFWMKRFSFEVNGTILLEKNTPGPAEVRVPGYELVNFQASYAIGSSFNFYLVLSNVFNRAFIARPDPEAMEEPARNLIIGMSYIF